MVAFTDPQAGNFGRRAFEDVHIMMLAYSQNTIFLCLKLEHRMNRCREGFGGTTVLQLVPYPKHLEMVERCGRGRSLLLGEEGVQEETGASVGSSLHLDQRESECLHKQLRCIVTVMNADYFSKLAFNYL